MPTDDLILRTNQHVWVIPYDCELLKALLHVKNLEAKDLLFNSRQQCQHFIRQVALLAAGDELRTSAPSVLAGLTQGLMQHSALPNTSVQQL